MISRQYNEAIRDIFKNASPEQKIFISELIQKFHDNISFSQLHYQGPLLGSEFNIYRPRLIYAALNLTISSKLSTTTNIIKCSAYDENNVEFATLMNSAAFYDSTIPQQTFMNNLRNIKNFYFSNIQDDVFDNSYLCFTGFRIGI